MSPDAAANPPARAEVDRTDEAEPAPRRRLGRAHDPAPRRRIGEWLVAVALLLMGGLVLRDGLQQPASTSASGVGAGFAPTVVGVLLLVLAAVLCVQIARGSLGEPETAEGDVDVRHTKWVPFGVCLAAVIFFIVAVEPLGYLIVSAVSFWLAAWAMGARSHWRSALIAVALSAAVYFSFTRLLEISLPAGVLSGLG